MNEVLYIIAAWAVGVCSGIWVAKRMIACAIEKADIRTGDKRMIRDVLGLQNGARQLIAHDCCNILPSIIGAVVAQLFFWTGVHLIGPKRYNLGCAWVILNGVIAIAGLIWLYRK